MDKINANYAQFDNQVANLVHDFLKETNMEELRFAFSQLATGCADDHSGDLEKLNRLISNLSDVKKLFLGGGDETEFYKEMKENLELSY